jgi:hypothetical protein
MCCNKPCHVDTTCTYCTFILRNIGNNNSFFLLHPKCKYIKRLYFTTNKTLITGEKSPLASDGPYHDVGSNGQT